MIVHQGKVVYEAFPGIQPTRPHVWASVTKLKESKPLAGEKPGEERDYVGVYFSTYPTYLDPDIMPGYIREISKCFAEK